ncbi:MAG: 50S ribosomal protein L31 [Anaerolineae bacterium CG_4_9_14_3_um_filter_57_17]|nr:50S ribosomal protein L31 [bacterium]NCT21899.1 50S ribosomal protein L31 [bacterium]OIO84656.1 MAG: 50S ribosomal protein L31 [Anaerolineae bacterium CG2_30_57_67]PJB65939.1 MAG: 50S ribosomal protein L31 [Anaerolineae bacterium CG_4_9_14_3_um_filter_57_17]
MKAEIHPKYYSDAKVSCASCGATWTTGSTRKELRVEICSNCHPFFTGESSRMIDIEGQVDRFYKKLQARQDYVEGQKAKEGAKTSPNRPVADLELGPRATKALAAAGITEIGALMAKLTESDAAALAVEGFGRKSLIDAKKKLRAMGYDVPETAAKAA